MMNGGIFNVQYSMFNVQPVVLPGTKHPKKRIPPENRWGFKV
jgi:hypothetical protein